MTQTTCATCPSQIDPTTAGMNNDGDTVCETCFEDAKTIAQLQQSEGANPVGLAFALIALGIAVVRLALTLS